VNLSLLKLLTELAIGLAIAFGAALCAIASQQEDTRRVLIQAMHSRKRHAIR
jgi:hypothetical protein